MSLALLKTAIVEQGVQRLSHSGIPTYGAQKGQPRWRYAVVGEEGGDRILRLSTGDKIMQWKLNSAEDATRIEDLADEKLEDGQIHASGAAQVHKSSPSLIHATMQDGRIGSTFSLTKQQGDNWKVQHKPGKEPLQNTALQFVQAFKEKTAALTKEQSALEKLKRHLKGFDYHVVLTTPGGDGASMHRATGESTAVRSAREAHKAWEKTQGIDTEHDWAKSAGVDRSTLPFRESAEAILMDNGSLISQLKANPNTGNQYVKFPGGGVDTGEDPVKAVRREIMEEAGAIPQGRLRHHGAADIVWGPDFVHDDKTRQRYNEFQGSRRHVYSGILKRRVSPTSTEGDAWSGDVRLPVEDALKVIEPQAKVEEQKALQLRAIRYLLNKRAELGKVMSECPVCDKIFDTGMLSDNPEKVRDKKCPKCKGESKLERTLDEKTKDMGKVAIIEKIDGEYILWTKDRSKRLGTHKTRLGAIKQEYAIQKSQESESKLAHLLAHYSRAKHKELRPLSYDELVIDRTSGRWKDKPEMAQQYVADRRRFESALHRRLAAKNMPTDKGQSFLYSTIDGKEDFGEPGQYKHISSLDEDTINRSFFDVVGAGKGRTTLGLKGLQLALKKWDAAKASNGLTESEYMGMKIKPRIEVITPRAIVPNQVSKLALLKEASLVTAATSKLANDSEKRFKKVITNPDTGRERTVEYGQAGKASDGGDRIRPGTSKGDAYCARSAKIKGDWASDPNSPNRLSRRKWKCRGSKSVVKSANAEAAIPEATERSETAGGKASVKVRNWLNTQLKAGNKIERYTAALKNMGKKNLDPEIDNDLTQLLYESGVEDAPLSFEGQVYDDFWQDFNEAYVAPLDTEPVKVNASPSGAQKLSIFHKKAKLDSPKCKTPNLNKLADFTFNDFTSPLTDPNPIKATATAAVVGAGLGAGLHYYQKLKRLLSGEEEPENEPSLLGHIGRGAAAGAGTSLLWRGVNESMGGQRTRGKDEPIKRASLNRSEIIARIMSDYSLSDHERSLLIAMAEEASQSGLSLSPAALSNAGLGALAGWIASKMGGFGNAGQLVGAGLGAGIGAMFTNPSSAEYYRGYTTY